MDGKAVIRHDSGLSIVTACWFLVTEDRHSVNGMEDEEAAKIRQNKCEHI